MKTSTRYDVIVMGASAGGLQAFTVLLDALPADFPIPIIIVQHRTRDQGTLLEEVLQSKCAIRIKQADEKEKILGGHVYVAPPDYHLLVEADGTLALDSEAPVRFSRPSIDVLFQSAADIYKERTVGIILTGASADGAEGISAIRTTGGTTISQDPEEATVPVMPQAAIATGSVGMVMKLDAIQKFITDLAI